MTVLVIPYETFDILNHKGPKHNRLTKSSIRIRESLLNCVRRILTTVHGVILALYQQGFLILFLQRSFVRAELASLSGVLGFFQLLTQVQMRIADIKPT